MKKFLAAAAVAASVTVGGATAGAASPTSSATAAPAAAIAAVPARATCSGTVNQAARAVTLERVYGGIYGACKARFPNALNWNNNGCSFPSWMYDIRGLGAVINHYGGEFQKSCDRHDFGYRNHGKSGVVRHAVDIRFRDNMYHQCDVNHLDGLPPWIACRAAAKLIFEVVDSFGGRFW